MCANVIYLFILTPNFPDFRELYQLKEKYADVNIKMNLNEASKLIQIVYEHVIVAYSRLI